MNYIYKNMCSSLALDKKLYNGSFFDIYFLYINIGFICNA